MDKKILLSLVPMMDLYYTERAKVTPLNGQFNRDNFVKVIGLINKIAKEAIEADIDLDDFTEALDFWAQETAEVLDTGAKSI